MEGVQALFDLGTAANILNAVGTLATAVVGYLAYRLMRARKGNER